MIRLFLTFFLMIAWVSGQAMSVEQKHIAGYVEKIKLPELAQTVRAKLDTGAKSSSLSAIDIKEFEKDGEIYVTFTVPLKSGPVTLTKPIIGSAKIKRRASEMIKSKHTAFERPEIEMTVQLNQQTYQIKMNLANRQRFNYPVLIGRQAIKEMHLIIDPDKAYLLSKIKD